MKAGVVVFPGSNCDVDCYHVLKDVLSVDTRYVWHKDTDISDLDLIVLPGGFSYGDYLRAGAIARFSPVMNSVIDAAKKGVPIIGICNGFQILTEAGLLPGVLRRNKNLKFICDTVQIQAVNTDSPFTKKLKSGQILNIPIAHGEGNYYVDNDTLEKLKDKGLIAFRYLEDVNGSVDRIAGVLNENKNVLGMMPHPERASESILGSEDGRAIFESVVEYLL
ncbi:phosphoribosylformylglycinamidine synthase subunit I [Caldanaerobius fijiensis DSM 17918]|uniref:Phosphoribosylformylglycinamidine synthase subunit PurQ n=1 Tax=Caldanaerobius fijiensis DSM 17918 TaxID=1121256 RepID=A0A1M5A761_9THEO|nr:phosphoribosylformylglycinamidine synthase subunit PurQ [Caldanaerobius fijiensis]SHF25876.1 phosphoribosylformylglycinamidine synthase subunit I [Caldanaerobius fijiensis DSM 17918]